MDHFSNSPELLLNNLLNDNNKLTISREIHVAYKIVDDFCTNYCKIGDKLKDQYRVKALNCMVEHRLIEAANNHSLESFYWNEEPNSIRNCYHLKLKNPNAILTVSQVRDKNGFPRNAKYRTMHRYSYQLKLEGIDDGSGEQLPYIIITHGYKSSTPQFIRVGVPESLPLKAWAYQIDISNVSVNDDVSIIEEKDSVMLRNLEKIVEMG